MSLLLTVPAEAQEQIHEEKSLLISVSLQSLEGFPEVLGVLAKYCKFSLDEKVTRQHFQKLQKKNLQSIKGTVALWLTIKKTKPQINT